MIPEARVCVPQGVRGDISARLYVPWRACFSLSVELFAWLRSVWVILTVDAQKGPRPNNTCAHPKTVRSRFETLSKLRVHLPTLLHLHVPKDLRDTLGSLYNKFGKTRPANTTAVPNIYNIINTVNELGLVKMPWSQALWFCCATWRGTPIQANW